MTATGKEIQDNQTLTNPNGTFTLWSRGARNVNKLATDMTITYQFGCEKASYALNNITHIDTYMFTTGKDDQGY